MSEHDHAHDHDHSELSDIQLRVRALETILTEKGYVDPAALDQLVDSYETKIGPKNGARIVARAWVDPEFKARLLQDATAAVNALGHVSPVGSHLIAVENTPQTHNLIVCTLCSCYPIALLGPSPTWYKSEAYRSRVVRDPRAVLSEFGYELPAGVAIHVWDASAESRYMVLPSRPGGTDDLDEQSLAALVTRNGLIGVAPV